MSCSEYAFQQFVLATFFVHAKPYTQLHKTPHNNPTGCIHIRMADCKGCVKNCNIRMFLETAK